MITRTDIFRLFVRAFWHNDFDGELCSDLLQSFAAWTNQIAVVARVQSVFDLDRHQCQNRHFCCLHFFFATRDLNFVVIGRVVTTGKLDVDIKFRLDLKGKFLGDVAIFRHSSL